MRLVDVLRDALLRAPPNGSRALLAGFWLWRMCILLVPILLLLGWLVVDHAHARWLDTWDRTFDPDDLESFFLLLLVGLPSALAMQAASVLLVHLAPWLALPSGVLLALGLGRALAEGGRSFASGAFTLGAVAFALLVPAPLLAFVTPWFIPALILPLLALGLVLVGRRRVGSW